MRCTTGIGSALLCLAFILPAQAEDEACARTISVVGRAEASHAPDYIALTLASESKAPNVTGALDGSAKAIAEIGALARDAGVPASEVRTTSTVLETATRTVSRALGSDQQEPDGFRVSNRVSVRLTDRSKTGEFVRRTLDKGGIRIEAVELGLNDPEKAEAALLVAAAKNARAQARDLAEATGTTAGAVCSLKAGPVQQTPPMPEPSSMPVKKKFDYSRSYDGGDGKPRLYVPLESGAIELAAEVTAVFAAQP